MKKETLLSISQRTGFSVSTVSRVLSGNAARYRISQKTIDLVREEASKVNYTPDLIAKSLRTKKTNTVGLLIPSIENPFFANMSSYLINMMKHHGYNIILADSMENEENEQDAINSLLSRKVDGIIAAPAGSSSVVLEQLSASMPVVLIDRYYEMTSLPFVTTDNFKGGYMAMAHLIEKGYKNILAIQGSEMSMPNKERVRGVHKAITDYSDRNIRLQLDGNMFSNENGYNCTIKALNSPDRPDAIFAFSTTILLGAITALRENNVNIPNDIGVISFDDNTFLDYMNPAITRIAQSLQQICEITAELMLERLRNNHSNSNEQIKVVPNLIERQSC